METHVYEVNLGWQYARLGQLSSPVLTESIKVATPPEFPKGMPGVWSPEHLLVAAVAGCFMTTFLAIAENFQLDFDDFDCRAVGKLDKIDNTLMITEVDLFPELLLTDESDVEKANRVLQKAEKACLITHSIRSTVFMHPTIRTAVKEYD
ncbi:OsmC family peroxiredoxin [Spirosoma sp. HMF3257]|uniref:OsmC family peroxiredoxin n=1 Tax=Spirosoma telluris TaxID=2183553 RepID=A0A327NTE1_9BACT|nr:OsmC family peroxiredoxin [Spirosoma telluris]RAI77843.1 OsmC family peroxiredoxin [Spirosoma telluris]